MLEKIEADFRKHWASWIGFGVLVVIGVPLFTSPTPQLVMVLIYWVLCCMGLFWEVTSEKQFGYISDEERNKPYDDWGGLYIRLPCLPTIRRKAKVRKKPYE